MQFRSSSCFLIAALLLAVPGSLSGEEAGEARAAATLPDLSGLAWLANGTFLAVHDAKNPEENDRARASLLRLPESLEGVTWEPVELAWPEPQGPSSDLESAAGIPDTRLVLLVESGEGAAGGQQFRRIFLAEYGEHDLKLVESTEWPRPVENVEGTTVARAGEQLVFIYAERAQGRPSTKIRWAPLELRPLEFGAFKEVTFEIPEPEGVLNRPVTGIDADGEGRLYVLSALDPGDDDGPFRSVVWRVGRVEAAGDSAPRVVLDDAPQRMATLDGYKAESVVVRQGSDGKAELFVGTDDENYGGTLRPLP